MNFQGNVAICCINLIILSQVERDRLIMKIESVQNGKSLDEINDTSDKVRFYSCLELSNSLVFLVNYLIDD